MKRVPWSGRQREAPLAPVIEDRIWTEVQHRIALGSVGRPSLTPRPDRRPLILAAAMVACAVLATGLLANQGAGPADEVATASAGPSAVTWDSLAAAAAEQPLRQMSDRDVLTLTIDYLPTDQQRAEDVRGRREELTIAHDGRGQRRVTSLPEAPGTVEARVTTLDEPGSMLVAGLTPAQIAALPASSHALRDALLASTETLGSWPDTFLVLELLVVTLVPPPARATLFTLMADLGVELRGATTDSLGRPGVVVVAHAPGGERIEAVIDPATTTVLSLRRHDPQSTEFDPALALYRSVRIGPGR